MPHDEKCREVTARVYECLLDGQLHTRIIIPMGENEPHVLFDVKTLPNGEIHTRRNYAGKITSLEIFLEPLDEYMKDVI